MLIRILYLFSAWITPFPAGDADTLVIRAPHDRFTTDGLGNIYLSDDAELVKYNATGKRMARYSNLKLGDISTVDAMNPLKILLYYRDYQQVVFLDNQLSPNGQPIALERLGLEQSDLVCASVNNGFWVYDKRNNELHRFSEQSRKLASTGNLRQVLSQEIVPSGMTEHNNLLYLNCPGSGIYVFDIFGTFSRLIPIRDATSLRVSGDLVYSLRPLRLCSFDLLKLEESCDSLWHPGIVAADVNGKHRFFSFSDSLVVLLR